jgi:hypothetical protein
MMKSVNELLRLFTRRTKAEKAYRETEQLRDVKAPRLPAPSVVSRANGTPKSTRGCYERG